MSPAQPPTPRPALAVASLANADMIVQRLGARYLASLVDPPIRPETPTPVPARNHLVLHLDDIEGRPGTPPEPEHVTRLLEFYRHWNGDGPLVVHCVAGVSRSSAAAYILACAHLPGEEQRIADYMQAQPYMTHPNRRLIALGDAHLGRSGKMTAATENWLTGIAGLAQLGAAPEAASDHLYIPLDPNRLARAQDRG